MLLRKHGKNSGKPKQDPDPLALVLPELPESYEATFSRCIDA
jgi:hypothetical protein